MEEEIRYTTNIVLPNRLVGREWSQDSWKDNRRFRCIVVRSIDMDMVVSHYNNNYPSPNIEASFLTALFEALSIEVLTLKENPARFSTSHIRGV